MNIQKEELYTDEMKIKSFQTVFRVLAPTWEIVYDYSKRL